MWTFEMIPNKLVKRAELNSLDKQIFYTGEKTVHVLLDHCLGF